MYSVRRIVKTCQISKFRWVRRLFRLLNDAAHR